MKLGKNKMILGVLIVSIMSGVVGCAKKESDAVGKPDEEESYEDTSADNILESDLSEPEEGREQNAEYPDPVLFPETFAFEYEVWQKNSTQIKTPGGILPVGDMVLVCDTGNHCVVRLTTEGVFVESYGELGSESGNFIEPTALLFYEDEIYVLDSGNRRIQVFDKTMQFDREIPFEASLKESQKYVDMAIDGDETIYLVADSPYREESGLFYIEDGALCRIPCDFSGYLAEQDGVVYAVDTWQFYTAENGYGKRPGENWLYEVGKSELKKVCELPYMYAPMDFIVSGEELYTVSTVWGEMNRVSKDGELLEALFYIESIQAHNIYVGMQDENTFYVADTKGYLYKVIRAEGEQ